IDKIMDETGWRILGELQQNARISFSELGRRVALTPPAVAERVRRMEEAGIIAGYRAQPAHDRIGLPITAFIRWTATGNDCAYLGEVARDIPEVVECHRVTGEESYVVKVVVRSVEHLEDLIDRMMPYGETKTSVVLSSPVTHRAVEMEQATPAPAPPTPIARSRRTARVRDVS
ncbi:MAG TPA: Lrp/AsnC family transcriptional regulator, partial [Actinomycetota bacterium]|nr:Lrp/AsnC family transcriptional regulator [Actinomycetota bacterium]